MSTDTSTPAREDIAGLDDYDRMLELTEQLIEQSAEKIATGRVRDAENERVRQGWYRAFANLIGEWRKLKETSDLQELSERIEELEDQREPVRA